VADDRWLQLCARYWQLYQQQWLQQLQLLALETERACLSLVLITLLLLVSVVLYFGAWILLLCLLWQVITAFGATEMLATLLLLLMHLLLLWWCRSLIKTYRRWLSFPATRHQFSHARPETGSTASESKHAPPQNAENKDDSCDNTYNI
jgi:ABC-type nickel/cobalt efflux system permease component RcnA